MRKTREKKKEKYFHLIGLMFKFFPKKKKPANARSSITHSYIKCQKPKRFNVHNTSFAGTSEAC